MNLPIATIDFTTTDGRLGVATLGEDYVWTCPVDRRIEDELKSRFPVLDFSPVGVPGAREAHAAAAWLKGSLTFPRTGRPTGDVDY